MSPSILVSRRWIAALAILVRPGLVAAQTRPISIALGAGVGTVSGSLADGANTGFTIGLGLERPAASHVTLGAELIWTTKGARLDGLNAVYVNDPSVSFDELGIAPVARFQVGNKTQPVRTVVSTGLKVWQSTGCSIDYKSDFDSGTLTDSCDGFAPDTGPFKGLERSAGVSLLLGIGIRGGKHGGEIRLEQPLGNGARSDSKTLQFGQTVSVLYRVYPRWKKRAETAT